MTHRTATTQPAHPPPNAAALSRPRNRGPVTHRVAAARAVWGSGVLVSWRYLPIPRKAALLLGFRHLAQAAATARRPGGVVARWGWTVDAAHSLSMLGLAAVSRRWRGAALVNAAVAAAWARAARNHTGERSQP